jgi:transcriptional regulator with XRE-family HTH domain
MSEANFSDWIKTFLKEKKAGWTGGTLAERARISRAGAYKYITGERVPNETALKKIAAALEIDRASMPSFTPRRTK